MENQKSEDKPEREKDVGTNDQTASQVAKDNNTDNTAEKVDGEGGSKNDICDNKDKSDKVIDSEPTKASRQASDQEDVKGEEGDETTGGEETSSSGSGVVKFKRLKLNHRNYRDKSQEDLPSVVENVSDSGEDGDSPQQTGSKRKAKSKKETNQPEKYVFRDDSSNSSSSEGSEDDEVINLQEQLSSSSSSSSSSIDFDVEDRDLEDRVGGRRILRLGLDTSEDEDDENEGNGVQEDGQMDAQAESDADAILNKPHHKPTFNIRNYKQIHAEVNYGKRRKLQNSVYSSIPTVQRLHVNYKLEGHEGCVNSLHFNESGTKLASGSDDLMIIVWDWEHKRKLTTFPTGHRENVFQSKFLPGDLLITSCSRDGQVRLAELCPAGSLRSAIKLAQHRGSVHKLTLVDNNQVVLSAGEDAQVLVCDTREQKSDKLLLLKNEKDKKIPIYSIHKNPANQNQFCTAGREHNIRIFDRRYIDGSNPREIAKFCPRALRSQDSMRAYITCAVFSYDGQEIIGSYSDEDIYLFKTSDGEGAEHVKQYKGHRNSATVKGVNFFGPRSEYVVSGSDCGNVFFWSKETESVVNISKGDDNGVVNVLEPHPTMPILATSGLDEEVKIWYPNKAITDQEDREETNRLFIKKTIKKNLIDRLDKTDDSDSIYGHLLYQLWNNLRRVEQRRSAGGGGGESGGGGEDGGGEDGGSSDEDDEGPRRQQCVQS